MDDNDYMKYIEELRLLRVILNNLIKKIEKKIGVD